MEHTVKTRTRIFDIVGIAIAFCLFVAGYWQESEGYEYFQLEVGTMALVGFVGVFYPFRSFMRYLWFGAAPLFAAIIPILGIELFESLNRPPNTSWGGGESVASIGVLMCYLGFLGCWGTFRLIGFRLRSETHELARNQLSLHELLAITALLAVMLVVFMEYLNPNPFRGTDYLSRMPSWSMVLLAIGHIVFFHSAVILSMTLEHRILRLLFGFLAVLCLFYADLFSDFALTDLAFPLTVSVTACLLGRSVGFRLTTNVDEQLQSS